MIEIYKWNTHLRGDRLKMMMIEVTHFSTFILSLFTEINPLRIFKSPLEEQFLILIRSFFRLGSSIFQPLNCHPLLFIQLLDLNIIELVIVQKFTEQYIQIRRPLANDITLLNEGRLQFIRKFSKWRLELVKRNILSLLLHAYSLICNQFLTRNLGLDIVQILIIEARRDAPIAMETLRIAVHSAHRSPSQKSVSSPPRSYTAELLILSSEDPPSPISPNIYSARSLYSISAVSIDSPGPQYPAPQPPASEQPSRPKIRCLEY